MLLTTNIGEINIITDKRQHLNLGKEAKICPRGYHLEVEYGIFGRFKSVKCVNNKSH